MTAIDQSPAVVTAVDDRDLDRPPLDGDLDPTPTAGVARDDAGSPWWRRALARPVRRPVAWYRRPWDDARMIRLSVTTASLVITTYVMLKIVHAVPFVDDALFWDRTPDGGDLGAHVWAPAYLRDNLLPDFRIQGWSMDWYAGLPVYRFYMVIPALAITLLDAVPGIPYGVAMKIVVASGLVSLPICSWAFGRLARFRYPMPELFAFAGLCFLLNESYRIMGGNVLSTMAGEFSFSIAMSLMVLGLGLLCRALDDGRLPVWAAVILALAGLSHGIVLIYTVVAAIVIVVCKCGRDLWRVFVEVVSEGRAPSAARGIVYGLLMAPAAVAVAVLGHVRFDLPLVVPLAIGLAAVVAVGVLAVILGRSSPANQTFYRRLGFASLIGALMVALSAFWVLPFLFNHEYMTDMKYGYEPRGGSYSSWRQMFFDLHPVLNVIVYTLAIIGFVFSVLRRHVYGIAIGLTTLVAIVITYVAKESLPVIGLLWNPRVLPLVYIMRYLTMMVGVVELGGLLVNIVRDHRALRPMSVGPASGFGVLGGVAVLAAFAFGFQVMPFAEFRGEGTERVYSLGPIEDEATGRSKSDGWTRYNFLGYENTGSYPEYRQLMLDMQEVGDTHGCGRALWEIDNRDGVGNGKYGTTMALMLMPFWTDGCIASSEGLYFEASGTTPYHFLTAAAASHKASNPVRQLRYVNNDVAASVELMQALGIKYYMVTTPEASAQAEQLPELELLIDSGPWHIYAVADSALVEPLTVQPVVVEERVGDQRECWLEVGTSWFQNQGSWAAVPAADGPAEWQRVSVAIDAAQIDPVGQSTEGCGDPYFGDQGRGRKVHVVEPTTAIEPQELPEIEVTNVVEGQESVSFDVSDIGVPVVVKVSYFPNWTVKGAEGPYRIAPNFMVVVPTDTHVELTYDAYSTKDLAFYGLTGLGIVGAIVVRRRGPFSFGDDARDRGDEGDRGGDDVYGGALDRSIPGNRWEQPWDTRATTPVTPVTSADATGVAPPAAWRTDAPDDVFRPPSTPVAPAGFGVPEAPTVAPALSPAPASAPALSPAPDVASLDAPADDRVAAPPVPDVAEPGPTEPGPTEPGRSPDWEQVWADELDAHTPPPAPGTAPTDGLYSWINESTSTDDAHTGDQAPGGPTSDDPHPDDPHRDDPHRDDGAR